MRAKGRACKPSQRAQGARPGRRGEMCGSRAKLRPRRTEAGRHVQDSEGANLCKIVARGGERGKQACKGACKRLGDRCVCYGREEAGRTEGSGEGGKGLLEGWQVVESEGTPFPCGLGDDPPPSQARGWPSMALSVPPPQNRPFPPPSSPLVSSRPTPSALSCTHNLHSCPLL